MDVQNNQTVAGGETISVEKLECNENNSCRSAKFQGSRLNVQEVVCGTNNACGTGADICQAAKNGTLVPCSSI